MTSQTYQQKLKAQRKRHRRQIAKLRKEFDEGTYWSHTAFAAVKADLRTAEDKMNAALQSEKEARDQVLCLIEENERLRSGRKYPSTPEEFARAERIEESRARERHARMDGLTSAPNQPTTFLGWLRGLFR